MSLDPVRQPFVKWIMDQVLLKMANIAICVVFLIDLTFDPNPPDPKQSSEPGWIAAASLYPSAEKHVLSTHPEKSEVGGRLPHCREHFVKQIRSRTLIGVK